MSSRSSSSVKLRSTSRGCPARSCEAHAVRLVDGPAGEDRAQRRLPGDEAHRVPAPAAHAARVQEARGRLVVVDEALPGVVRELDHGVGVVVAGLDADRAVANRVGVGIPALEPEGEAPVLAARARRHRAATVAESTRQLLAVEGVEVDRTQSLRQPWGLLERPVYGRAAGRRGLVAVWRAREPPAQASPREPADPASPPRFHYRNPSRPPMRSAIGRAPQRPGRKGGCHGSSPAQLRPALP